MPDEDLQPLAKNIAWWLASSTKTATKHDDIFFALCKRIISLPPEDDLTDRDPVTRAINHPIGHVTQALMNWWFKRGPQDDERLPPRLSTLLTSLCDKNVNSYRHARILLASNIIALYRVDREWTQSTLIPLFDWNSDADEALAAWEGFLWSPRLYRPLMSVLKVHFLRTAEHYEELARTGQYAAVLVFAALEPADVFTPAELQRATRALPQGGLHESARALVRAVESAGERREEYWLNRVRPYLQKVWPKSKNLASDIIAEQFARLSIAAGPSFPEAVGIVLHWLRPLQHASFAVHSLCESKLCGQFPVATLQLLDAIVNLDAWPPAELRACLDAILQGAPHLADDAVFKRLMEHAQRDR
jgi:hypothetical protein